jgi:hypothetical protein
MLLSPAASALESREEAALTMRPTPAASMRPGATTMLSRGNAAFSAGCGSSEARLGESKEVRLPFGASAGAVGEGSIGIADDAGSQRMVALSCATVVFTLCAVARTGCIDSTTSDSLQQADKAGKAGKAAGAGRGGEGRGGAGRVLTRQHGC